MRSFNGGWLMACVLAFATPSLGFAQTLPSKSVPTYKPVVFNGVDVAPLIEFAKVDLRKVTVPFKIYHWDQGGQSAHWKTISSGHAAGFAKALQAAATVPFRALGNPGGTANMYGSGFYSSLDPVATRTYGGYDGSDSSSTPSTAAIWQLTEITVPPGVVFLDLNSARAFTTSKQDLSKILAAFECTASNADGFFREGGASLTSKCVDLVRFVYQKTLQIDLLSYNYSTTSFLTCEQGLSKMGTDNDRAMVLTNGRWIKPSLVFVMHSTSTDEVETRRLIQTLFLYSSYASSVSFTLDPHAAKATIVKLLTANPTFSIQGGAVSCSGSQCSMTVNACPPGVLASKQASLCTSDGVTLPPPRRGVFHRSDFSSTGFLWPDLEGQPKSTPDEVDAYLNANRLGCDGKERYVNIPTDAVKEGF